MHTLNQSKMEEQLIDVKRKLRGGEQLPPKSSSSIGCESPVNPSSSYGPRLIVLKPVRIFIKIYVGRTWCIYEGSIGTFERH